MDANLMSPEELRELANKKEEENNPVKVGFLKMDLYGFQSDSYESMSFKKSWGNFWLKTEKQKSATIEEFKSRFEKVLEKGAKFVCYMIDGEESWFDDEGYGVENMDNKWANKYLENIQDWKEVTWQN